MKNCFILLASWAFAIASFAQPDLDTEKDTNTDAEPTRFSSSTLYYRNPENGRLEVPPPEIAAALQQDSRNFSDEGLEIIKHPDGSTQIDLQGRFQMSSIIRQNDNGYEHLCTNHPLTEHAAGEYHTHDQTPQNDER